MEYASECLNWRRAFGKCLHCDLLEIRSWTQLLGLAFLNSRKGLLPTYCPGKLDCCPMHYAEVVEIRILKCPTLTNYFSLVFHPGCPKFCVELCELPKNLEKEKKIEFGEEKEQKNAKNMKGVFAKVTTGLKIRLDKCNNICFMHVLRKHPLISKKWTQSLKK